MPSFADNQVFRVRREGLTAFLKLADGPDLRREVAVLEVLGPLGVPVPVIEAADLSGDLAGVSCALLGEVAGEPVGCSSPEFPWAGQALRQVHGVMLEGHGLLAASQQGLRGEHRSWADAIAEHVDDLGRITESGLVDAGLLGQAAAAVRDRRDLLAGAESGHLLHGDFSPRHVFARNGRIAGIIDWGDAHCGDPLYDLGRILHSAVLEKHDVSYGLAVVDRVLSTYGDAPWLQRDITELMLTYAVAFILWSMQGELDGGAPWPPWWPNQAAALSAILDRL